jgi:transcriptional regulator with XRE-family HTH domain
MTISQRIFFELDRQNRTQKDLSEATGISTSTISAWNKRGTTPSADVIYPIAKFLGLTLEYLLIGEDATVNNSITTGDITGNYNANITTASADNCTEFEKEFSSILSGLSFRERTELMTLIYRFADEHKKDEA